MLVRQVSMGHDNIGKSPQKCYSCTDEGMVEKMACYRRGHVTEECMLQKRACCRRGHVTEECMLQKRAWYSRGHGTEEGMVQKRACIVTTRWIYKCTYI